MRPTPPRIAPVLVALTLALTACGTAAGGSGGATFSGGAAGTPCNATYQAEGCLAQPGGYAVMTCDPAGTWSQKAQCTAAQYCAEQPANDPAAPGKRIASCVAIPTGGATDAGASDGAAQDSGARAADTGGTDTGVTDTGVTDTGVTDAGVTDTGAPDTGAPDTGAPDTGTPDTGTPDTGTPDTGAPDTGPVLKQPLPKVQLLDISPGSPTSGQTVTLDQFAGNYIAVLMGAGWCASCNAQADFMEKIRKDLLNQGRKDVVMVVVNDKSAASKSNQKSMVTCDFSVCSPKGAPLGFPVLQGTSTYGWHSFTDPATGQKGKKNDCFVYGPDGTMLFKHVGKATVNLTAFDKEVRAALNK